MALTESTAIRFAEALDDYDNVRVTDLGGHGSDYWVRVQVHGSCFEVASEFDYWRVLEEVLGSPVKVAAPSVASA